MRNLTIISETDEMVKAVIDRSEWNDIEDGLQMQCALVEHLSNTKC